MKPSDVLLVVSPIAMIDLPSPALHLIQASCQYEGINCEILYANLLYSHIVGIDLHKIISLDWHLLMGERLFADSVFKQSPVSLKYSINKILDPSWVPDHLWKIKFSGDDQRAPTPINSFRKWIGDVDFLHLEILTQQWLLELAQQIVTQGYPIVGCSTSFGGLLPAIALLKIVKQLNPSIRTILGGALCDSEMAEGIISLKTNIDYIFSGEGEVTFPKIIDQILNSNPPKQNIIYGQEISDLGKIPIPNYSCYLSQLDAFHPQRTFQREKNIFPFETSRGCWYGKCTFCGMKGKKNTLRKKSPETVIQNLNAFIDQNGLNTILMTDTNMPPHYFKTVIPRLSKDVSPVKIVYEIKPNLSLRQVQALKRAGITEFQPGIESLSTSLLRKMKKPQTLIENISLLRYARSLEVKPRWNLLFGLPGDEISEYEEMIDLIPLIHHLEPPMQLCPLRFSRYSRYHQNPNDYNISNLKPAEVFFDIFPRDAELDKIAYYFSGDFPCQSHEHPDLLQRLWEKFQAWNQSWGNYRIVPIDAMRPGLQILRKSLNSYWISDTRGLENQPKEIEINREQVGLLLVAHPLTMVSPKNFHWAREKKLVIASEDWVIPLATADPMLIQEFETECVYKN